jgi:hypothetical protein
MDSHRVLQQGIITQIPTSSTRQRSDKRKGYKRNRKHISPRLPLERDCAAILRIKAEAPLEEHLYASLNLFTGTSTCIDLTSNPSINSKNLTCPLDKLDFNSTISPPESLHSTTRHLSKHIKASIESNIPSKKKYSLRCQC